MTPRACLLTCCIVGWLLLVPAAASAPAEVSFRNDVMAVLSKAGCNSGGCHGNANGKAGFKISLRGEDPEGDFQILTRDQLGRRLNLTDPGQSLALLKATAAVAHEGGRRFSDSSPEYEMLRAWIANGAPADPPDTPRLEKIHVTPESAILTDPADSIQLSAEAIFSDGSKRDITSMAVYETSSVTVRVSPGGLVQRQQPGEVTVLVRFLNRQQPVRLAFIPDRPDFAWTGSPPGNLVDEHIFSKLRSLKINPSAVAPDEVFIRRAYLDLLGILPTPREARVFIHDRLPNKRAILIDALLARPEFADFWALKWADLLRLEERALDQKGVQLLHGWLRQSFAEGKPFDVFTRELIAARGSTYTSPPANFYRANRDPITRAEAVAQVFLGTRLQCAQCHNHPFDRWTQDDYYNWAAVFSKVQYKVLENRRQDSNDSHEFKGEQIVFVARQGEVKNPRTGKPAQAAFLGGGPASGPAQDELEALAGWITRPDNPFFAQAQVNRVWFHLLGRGIVDPIDDFRATNPASHPELLAALATRFVRSGFNLREVIRLIMNSQTYQLSAFPNDTNAEDESNFSRALVRRLTAEQLIDCQQQVLGAAGEFDGYPSGLRAAQLPGVIGERRRGRKTSSVEQFLTVFGKPARLLTCECERSSEATMGQAFQMITGPALNQLLIDPGNRLKRLAESQRAPEELIEELYWSALTRPPSSLELSAALRHFEITPNRRAALEDLTWSLLNAKEFILRQ